jgi:hypothetical protein
MASGGFRTYTLNQLQSLKTYQLKNYLSELGLQASGNKAKLIDRICSFYEENNIRLDVGTNTFTNRSPVSTNAKVVQSAVDVLNLEAEKLELELEISRLQLALSKSLQALTPQSPAQVVHSTPFTKRPDAEQKSAPSSIPSPDNITAPSTLHRTNPPHIDNHDSSNAAPAPVTNPHTSMPMHSSSFVGRDEMTSMMKAFSDNLSLIRLPVSEPPSFSGDALTYPDWNRAFKAMIESKGGLSEDDKMFYLRRYLRGPPLEAVDGFTVGNCYSEAKSLLDERYGDSYVIAEAYRSKLSKWPRIPKAQYGKHLCQLSDFLVKCRSTMVEVPELQILNDSHQNQNILRLLPDHIIRRWNVQVVKSKSEGKGFPLFSNFVEFMKLEAEQACHPTTSVEAVRNLTRSSTPSPAPKPAVSHSVSISKEVCGVCQGHHKVFRCDKFKSLSVSDRQSKARELKLCFLCLNPGHGSDKCLRTFRCHQCKRRHNSLLH